jgi:hypothetical protein
LEHRASVKSLVSLQFLNLKQSVGLLRRGISPSQGRYLIQIQNKYRHACLEWGSKPRSQCSSGRRHFMPQIARPLSSAVYHIEIMQEILLHNASIWRAVCQRIF